MHSTKTIENFNKKELEMNIKGQASWHNDYNNSAYIFIGGLNYNMNEGDISVVFSQFGEIVDLYLIRDQISGKSKGYCFLCYQDQQSTILAVDNFNNAEICGRNIRVDHVREYKPPNQYFLNYQNQSYLNQQQEIQDQQVKLYQPSGPDGNGWGKYRIMEEQEILNLQKIKQFNQASSKIQEDKYQVQKSYKFKSIIFDEDERWDTLLIQQQEQDNQKEASFNYDINQQKNQNQINKQIIKVKKNKKNKKDKKDNKDKQNKNKKLKKDIKDQQKINEINKKNKKQKDIKNKKDNQEKKNQYQKKDQSIQIILQQNIENNINQQQLL